MSIQNTAAASLLVDVVREIAEQGWKLATGEDTVKESVEKVVAKAVDAAIATVKAELQRELDALRLAYDISVLADKSRDVLDAFEPPAGGGMVGRVLDGIPITIVGPDAKLEESSLEPIDTKFDPEVEK